MQFQTFTSLVVSTKGWNFRSHLCFNDIWLSSLALLNYRLKFPTAHLVPQEPQTQCNRKQTHDHLLVPPTRFSSVPSHAESINHLLFLPLCHPFPLTARFVEFTVSLVYNPPVTFLLPWVSSSSFLIGTVCITLLTAILAVTFAPQVHPLCCCQNNYPKYVWSYSPTHRFYFTYRIKLKYVI